MWIVRIALSRPYTFIVMALLILILSPIVILPTPTDIFPSINIPVVAVAWTYSGLNPKEMEGRVTTVYERALTTTVDNIEHIESTTVNGTAIVKVFLQPNASIDRANAQITPISQNIPKQYLRDVATVGDGFSPQTNIVRQDGKRGVLVTIYKAGDASTLAVVDGVRKLLPRIAQTLPPALRIQPLA